MTNALTISEDSRKYKYQISGTVHPISAKVSIINLNYNLGFSHGDLSCDWTFEIVDSRILVSINTNAKIEDNQNQILDIRNIVKSSIELQVGVYCVANAYAYNVELEKITNFNCSWTQYFTIDLEVLSQDETIPTFEVLNKSTYQLIERYPDVLFFIKESFVDYQRGVSQADSSAMYFYRSIESIRQLVWRITKNCPEPEKRRQPWKIFYALVGDVGPENRST